MTRIFPLLFFSLLSSLAFANSQQNQSPVATPEWGITDFCETTIKSYLSAYRAGEREFVMLSLNESPTFKSLNATQKSAFLSIIGSAQEEENSGKNPVQSCKQKIKSALSHLSHERLAECQSLFMIARSLIRKEPQLSSINEGVIGIMKSQLIRIHESKQDAWAETIYYECVAQG